MAEPNLNASRQIKVVYRSTNGFTEQVSFGMSAAGPSSKVNLHAVAANPQAATKQDLREFHDAVQRRQFVEDMMELKGTYFPGLDAIKQANQVPDTAAILEKRIEDLKKNHIEEVRTLYQWHAQDYHDAMLDMSRSKPDIDDPGVESFYRTSRSSYDIINSFDDELDRHHYAYLGTLHALMKQHSELRKVEEDEQRRRDQQFPASVADFHAIRSKDVQLRIARFLTLDDSARERTMDEFNWVWRQVMPLITEYTKSDDFKAEIQALLRDVDVVRDPRKIRMATATT